LVAAAALISVGAPTASAEPFIYWANLNILAFDGTTIGRANLDGTGVDDSFITGAAGPCGVAVNSSHVYWQNSGLQTIGRANLDGSGADQGFIDLDAQNCGVAVDDEHVYWAASQRIGRANLDGTGVEQQIVSTPANNCGVAVDDAHVYWLNGPTNAIGRADLDGGNPDPTFIEGLNGNSCGVTADAAHVYWGNNSSIGRANLNGSSPDGDFIPGDGGNPSTPVVDDKHVYWANAANFSGDSIGRANLNGSAVDQDFITGLLGPVGLALSAPAAEPPSNEFTLGKLKRNKKKGTAKLTVEVPGPGELALSGKAVKPQRPLRGRPDRAHAKPVAAAGAVKLSIKPKGKAKKKLRKKGMAKVKYTVTYSPTGGTAASQNGKAKLKRKLKK
jgi:hypothetical protein